jgi:hypothetical protein
MKLKLFFILAIFLAILSSRFCSAQGSPNYLDNTGELIKTNTGLFGLLGMQFQAGTNAGGYVLNGLQLLFADAEGDPSPPKFRVILLADYFNSYGMELAHLQTTANPTNAGLYYFSPDRLVELQAGTNYWLLMFLYGGTSLGSYQWSFTETAHFASVDGWSITGNTLPGQPGFPMFSINATAIPEPSTLALLAAALAAIGCKYRAAKQT